MNVPTGSPAVRRPVLLRVVAALTERLPTKLVALLLALVLWLVVRGEESTEVILHARFAPLIDPSLELVGGAPDSVQVVVSGRRREVLKLQTNPPVVRRRFDEETARRARVTLQPVDVEFPIGVDATAREVRPNVFTMTFRSRTATNGTPR